MQRQVERVESIERMASEIHSPSAKPESPLRKYLKTPSNQQQARPGTAHNQNQSFTSAKKPISDIDALDNYFSQSINAPLTYDLVTQKQPTLLELLEDDIQIRQPPFELTEDNKDLEN